MPTSALQLLHFEGGNALSPFRAAALLAALQVACSRIVAVAARHVHWVAFDTAPDVAVHDKLEALLRYGDPGTGSVQGELIVVMPRLGTVSPWASKASDIAHNCGLPVHRVERVTEFRLTLKSGLFAAKPLSADERSAAALLLHDRMTESVAFEREAAAHLFDARNAAPLAHVNLLARGPEGGKIALVEANAEFGLALSDDEIDYLVGHFNRLQRTLRAAVLYGRDNDSIAGMAFGLFGALRGLDAIPLELRRASEAANRREWGRMTDEFRATINEILVKDQKRWRARMESASTDRD
jgi:phosphoribosylformylglycinamidine synthase